MVSLDSDREATLPPADTLLYIPPKANPWDWLNTMEQWAEQGFCILIC